MVRCRHGAILFVTDLDTKYAGVLEPPGDKAVIRDVLDFTWRNRRLPSPTRINLEEP
jgi:hypothetical protein